MKKHIFFLLICSFISASLYLSADGTNSVTDNIEEVEHPRVEITSSDIQEIPELKSKNTVFKKYQKDIENANKAMFMTKEPSVYLAFYKYTATKDDNLISLASRCSIRYDSILTLNSITNSTDKIEDREFILPVANGLYIPLNPQSSIEILLAKEHSEALLSKPVTICTINNREYYIMPDGRLSPTQRAYFFDSGLQLPLKKSYLTSSFGMRVSPISGRWLMHKGIDMAAPLGTPVYACKGGKVTSTVSMDRVYGNYIIIDHGKGMTSLYAHLSSIEVSTGSFVASGQEIGLVGKTGMATGYHLHFEIRLNGEPQDPQKLLKDPIK